MYVDIEGKVSDLQVVQVFVGILVKVSYVKIIGSYLVVQGMVQ